MVSTLVKGTVDLPTCSCASPPETVTLLTVPLTALPLASKPVMLAPDQTARRCRQVLADLHRVQRGRELRRCRNLAEAGGLSHDLALIGRIEGILILQLRDHQRQEIVGVERVQAIRGSRRSSRKTWIRYCSVELTVLMAFSPR